MFSKKYLGLGLNYGQDKANTNPPAENSLGIAWIEFLLKSLPTLSKISNVPDLLFEKVGLISKNSYFDPYSWLFWGNLSKDNFNPRSQTFFCA